MKITNIGKKKSEEKISNCSLQRCLCNEPLLLLPLKHAYNFSLNVRFFLRLFH